VGQDRQWAKPENGPMPTAEQRSSNNRSLEEAGGMPLAD
jgi:hypothetical protein